MISSERFRAAVERGVSASAVRAAAGAVRSGDVEAAERLTAAFAQAAFVAPGRVAELYDAAAEGWFGAPVGGPLVEAPAEAVPPPPAFWDGFFALAEDAGRGMDALEITSRTAALGGLLSPDHAGAAARAALAWPGVAAAAAEGWPPRIALEDLAACPPGSLGRTIHDLIVDNGFDLEVLDREALALSALPPPLDYLNARILQVHDLWHLTAGYATTRLHEVAISGFQLGQFGHGYSAMFLALVARATLANPQGVGLLLETVLSAYVHGRRTPPLIGVDWPAVWSERVEAVRARLGVEAYASPFPADLFEQFERAAA